MKFFIVTLFIIVTFISGCQAQTIKKTIGTTVAATQTVNKKLLIVYGSPDCHHCIDTKKYLTDNNIDFIFKNIDNDRIAVNEMLIKLKAANISTKGLGIPVIDKNGQIFQNNANFDDFLKKLTD